MDVDERSVLSTVRGVPGWTAVLLALAISLTGVAFDSGDGRLGAVFTVLYFVGCLVSVLAVRRRSVFVTGVQPPIVMTAIVPLVYMTAGAADNGGFFSRTQIISAALPLVERFPLMIVTTLVVGVTALVRAFVLQPARRHRH